MLQALVVGDEVPTWWQAAVLGLVEGLTEFLPVSSTGHLIVAQRWLGLAEGPASNLFAVGIQMGAITAILVLYWQRLWTATRTLLRPVPGQANLLWLIAIAAVPAIGMGLLLDEWIDRQLFSAQVVAATMMVGGVLLLWLERYLQRRPPGRETLGQIGYRTAFWIGWWQCLALVPGTSRSGAMIGGSLWLGVSRPAAAEFSFLVGLPILYGASLLKLWKQGELLRGELLQPFLVGTAMAFVSALLVVRPLVQFVRSHTFAVFGWYRLVAGALLWMALRAGWIEA